MSRAGTSSRPCLYLLDQPLSTPLRMTKLPKRRQILQRLEGLLLGNDITNKSNQKKNDIKEEAAASVAKEVTAVWKHHFGIRVIDGKDFDSEDESEEKKKMVIHDDLITKKILDLDQKYRRVKYESRRLKKRGNFVQMEADLKDELEKPLDITKEGGWKTVRMEDGSKQRVWLPSGEDILASSFSISGFSISSFRSASI